ncbi:MAG: O-antigen ligase family protein [Pseudaminobacter sp.]|nr:O-antigen ligase family protein [Pseudaminobacter sp.]
MTAVRATKSRPRMEDFDVWYSGYAATVPGMAGSWLSFLYYGAALWAVSSIVCRRYPIAIPRRAHLFAVSSVAYVICLSMAGYFAGGGTIPMLKSIAYSSAFLMIPLLIARYRFSDATRSLNIFCLYAPLGAVAGLSIALVQRFAFDTPPSGGAGNQNVFGVVMACLGCWSLAGIYGTSRSKKLLSIIGFGLGACGIFISDSRSLYLVVLLAPLLALFILRGRSSRTGFIFVILAVLAMMFVAIYANKDRIVSGYEFAKLDIELIQTGRVHTSLGLRWVLWNASLAAIEESPLIGHGPQFKMDAVRSHLPAGFPEVQFTHVHNGLLDTVVAGGLLTLIPWLALLASPLLMVFGIDNENPKRRFIVLSMLTIYLLSGSVGVMFGHDLLAVLYALPLILVAASDPGRNGVIWRFGVEAPLLLPEK